MKRIVLIIILLHPFLLFSVPYAKMDIQFADSDTTIKLEKIGTIGLNFMSVGLQNWAGGGNNAISIAGLTGLGLNYISSNMVLNNSLEAGYGVIKLGSESFRKSDDRLIISSKFGYKAADNLSYSALLDFRTQFDKGFDYNKKDSLGNFAYISNFMAPAYLTVGLGMNYKPADYLDLYLSPVSNRVIFVLDDSLSSIGAFGVDKGEKINSELGASLDLLIQKTLIENVDLKSRLNMFAPYEAFTTVVVNWEAGLMFKVNDYINAGFNVNVIYDEKVNITRDDNTKGPSTQIKHVISIGFAYKFDY